MSESKFIHTFLESKNIFASVQKAVVLSIAKDVRFHQDSMYIEHGNRNNLESKIFLPSLSNI